MKPQLHYLVLPFIEREEAEAALERSGLKGKVITDAQFEQDYLATLARLQGTIFRGGLRL